MKRIISVLLAGAMLASGAAALAGCGELYQHEINWDVDLSKPIPLKGLYPTTGMPSFGSDDTAAIIQEVTGYQIQYQELGLNEDNEVNGYLSTQEKFHFMKLTEAQYHPYLANGTFLDLTELLEKTESGRKLKALIDLMDYGWDAAAYVDKDGVRHLYGIPDFGYSVMVDSALIWNADHLKKIGYEEDGEAKIPETLGEVTDALEKLQALFGADNATYHALGIPGSNSSNINPIMSAFGCPLEFYVDADGNIQQYVFHEGVTKYVKYMNGLRRKKIISDAWQKSSSEDNCSKFANELISCTYQPYWYVTPLANSVVSNKKIAAAMGMENTYENVRDHVLRYQLRVRGDGTEGSPVQEKAMIQGDDAGVSYYTVIPAYMAEDALYVIDFLGKKMEHFAQFYGGTEGTHWNKLTPADFDASAPAAEEYTEERDAEFTAHENYAEKIIFVRPYSYTYDYGTAEDPHPVSVSGGGFWCQLTQRYIDHIVNNSQYCNGTNAVEANSLFHLRETGFDGWQVVTVKDDTIITNPMTMAPPLEHWAPISILARTTAKRGIASAIDATDPEAAIANTREGMRTTSAKKNNERYYYWSDTIVAEMTNWYREVKLNRS